MKMFSDTILENLKSIMVVLDQQGNLEYISSSVKNVLGYSPEQLMGGSWFDIAVTNKTEMKLFKTGISHLLKNNNEFQGVKYEQLFKTAYGKDKWILWSASKEGNDKLIAIGQDITEIKTTESLLIQRNNELFLKHTETKQSIEYASRLQSAILPTNEYFKSCAGNFFVFNQPKDIIGGDYYFVHKSGNKVIIVLVDCTGHGVPGALMSVVAHSMLKEVIVNRKITDPSTILYQLDLELDNVLNSSANGSNYDGMDVGIAVIDKDSSMLTYAGAFRPMLVVRNENVIEMKPNRFPIGFYADVNKIFKNEEMRLYVNDTLYLFTDGYSDQFGGEQNRKFNKKRFKELLLFIQSMEMDEQESFLGYAHNNWRQSESQTDDILVIGIQV